MSRISRISGQGACRCRPRGRGGAGGRVHRVTRDSRLHAHVRGRQMPGRCAGHRGPEGDVRLPHRAGEPEPAGGPDHQAVRHPHRAAAGAPEARSHVRRRRPRRGPRLRGDRADGAAHRPRDHHHGRAGSGSLHAEPGMPGGREALGVIAGRAHRRCHHAVAVPERGRRLLSPLAAGGHRSVQLRPAPERGRHRGSAAGAADPAVGAHRDRHRFPCHRAGAAGVSAACAGGRAGWRGLPAGRPVFRSDPGHPPRDRPDGHYLLRGPVMQPALPALRAGRGQGRRTAHQQTGHGDRSRRIRPADKDLVRWCAVPPRPPRSAGGDPPRQRGTADSRPDPPGARLGDKLLAAADRRQDGNRSDLL